LPLGLLLVVFAVCNTITSFSQSNPEVQEENLIVNAGIEIRENGVKLSVVEFGADAKRAGIFRVLKDTLVNTDFIAFDDPAFKATLDGMEALFVKAKSGYGISSDRIFTVVSSGVIGLAEKANKKEWIDRLIDSFRVRIGESSQNVKLMDLKEEARLLHLGIIPESRRYTTLLIDIGSGNTKGGYFPFEDRAEEFRLFGFEWGTKRVADAAEKRCDEYDKTLANFNRQLYRVLHAVESNELNFAVNSSGAYAMNDNIAFSGGIAWATATLLQPEELDRDVITVTYEDVEKLHGMIYSNYTSLSDSAIVSRLKISKAERKRIEKEVKRVHGVFDQRTL